MANGNPFRKETIDVTGELFRVGNAAAQLADTRLRAKQFASQEKRAGAEFGLEERKVELGEATQKLRESQFRADTPVAQQPFGIERLAGFNKAVKVEGTEKGYEPLILEMKDLVGKGSTNAQVYTGFKTNWPVWNEALKESTFSAYLSEKDPVIGQKYLDTLKMLQADNEGAILDQIMPITSRQVKEAARTPKEGLIEVSPGATLFDPSKGKPIFQAGFKPDAGGGVNKTQNELKDDYFKLLNQADRIETGVDQFTPDENRVVIAQDRRSQADIIAKQFIDKGGDPKDLGLEGSPKKKKDFKSAQEVRDAFISGLLTEKEAEDIIFEKF